MEFLDNFNNITGPHQISRICKVSKRTAQRWINGESKPKKIYIELLHLHDSGRIMPAKWNTYCQFTGDYLDFGHKRAISHQELDWYLYSIKFWHQTLDLLPAIESRLDALMKVCPPADVIDLQTYRDEIQRLKNRPFYMPQGEPLTAPETLPKLASRSHGC